MAPENLLYTPEHEWILMEGSKAKVGITDYAQSQLGDVVYVELPRKGSSIEQMKPCGVVESVKTVSELYSPLSGTVQEINSNLAEHPENINQDPYGEGWMFLLEIRDPKETGKLLPPQEYKKLIGE